MYQRKYLTPPFFEIGPKQYLYGDDILDLALIAEEASIKHRVQVIYTVPYADIRRVADATRNLIIFAPHMDDIPIGRGLADVLPESVRAAGADGVMLNHVEKPLTYAKMINTVKRAKDLNMITLLLADSIVEAQALALLRPDAITAEPSELIATGNAVKDYSYIHKAIEAIHAIDPNIYVLIGAGISSGNDVYNVIKEGADASGSSSAIALAKDKRAIVNEMLQAAREAWDERHSK